MIKRVVMKDLNSYQFWKAWASAKFLEIIGYNASTLRYNNIANIIYTMYILTQTKIV